ncbi:hypothetical protein ACIBQX_23015 [Nonomuraea sp. NPDC049714]|uniref:hypothetical protein n=1 Tax=Nonomuraea sp. NPDC049714 TaxID=3364357 RepID=UPI0037A3E956
MQASPTIARRHLLGGGLALLAAPTVGSAPLAEAKVHRSWTQHGLLLVAPFLLVYVAFLVWPTLPGLRMSFSSVNIAGSNDHLVGFANYAEAFGDPRMWRTSSGPSWSPPTRTR